MIFLVFDSEPLAEAANSTIGTNMGCSIVAENAATGLPDPSAQRTVRWAVPRRRLDGKWVLPKPDQEFMAGVDASEVEYDPAWFPRAIPIIE